MSTELVERLRDFAVHLEPASDLYTDEISALREAADELTALIAKVALLTEALQAIIDMNVQYAIDKYGDASRAEGMACVVAARRALSKPDKNET